MIRTLQGASTDVLYSSAWMAKTRDRSEFSTVRCSTTETTKMTFQTCRLLPPPNPHRKIQGILIWS